MTINDTLARRISQARREEEAAAERYARLVCAAIAAEAPDDAVFLELREDYREGTVTATGTCHTAAGTRRELSEAEAMRVYPWVSCLTADNHSGWVTQCYSLGGGVEDEEYLLDLKQAADRHHETTTPLERGTPAEAVGTEDLCAQRCQLLRADGSAQKRDRSDDRRNSSARDQPISAVISQLSSRIDKHEASWELCKVKNVPTYDPVTGEAEPGEDTDLLDQIETDQAFAAQAILRRVAKVLRAAIC
ncbi:hypothetical protein ABZ569_33305 [Streptomyces albus]|uniref:hypothetical protein n=1 Tax=Streptomyces albus TaxID=1888 RepID=UPI0033EA2C61